MAACTDHHVRFVFIFRESFCQSALSAADELAPARPLAAGPQELELKPQVTCWLATRVAFYVILRPYRTAKHAPNTTQSALSAAARGMYVHLVLPLVPDGTMVVR